jgi:hypothetical protein
MTTLAQKQEIVRVTQLLLGKIYLCSKTSAAADYFMIRIRIGVLKHMFAVCMHVKISAILKLYYICLFV